MKITVVGSGVMGAWTAYELLQRGHDVTLCESYYPGHSKSSSGGESRLIRGIYGKDEIYMDWVNQSMNSWNDLQEKVGVKLFYPAGTLWMFGDDTEYGDYAYEYLKKIEWDINPMSIDKARTKFPQINFEDISKIYHEPSSGYLMARLACQLLKKRITELGGIYRQQHIEVDEEQMLNAQSDFTQEADFTVFACGPWLKKMFKNTLGNHLKISRQEIYYFSSPTPDMRYHVPNMPTWIDLSEKNYYGIPFTDQRGFKMADDTRKSDEELDVDNLDRIPENDGVQKMKKYLVHRFPEFDQPMLSEGRVCQYTNTADGNFILDFFPGRNNILLAGGGSGHAFKLGPSIGYHLADLVEQKVKPINMFSLARLTTNQEFKSQFKRNNSFY